MVRLQTLAEGNYVENTYLLKVLKTNPKSGAEGMERNTLPARKSGLETQRKHRSKGLRQSLGWTSLRGASGSQWYGRWHIAGKPYMHSIQGTF